MSDKRRDRLRNLIHLSIEAYNIAASAPAVDYSRGIDPQERIDYIPTNRERLLATGIDVKYTLLNYCKSIPEKRAETLLNWIADGSNISEYRLSDWQRLHLRADRNRLKYILLDNGYK